MYRNGRSGGLIVWGDTMTMVGANTVRGRAAEGAERTSKVASGRRTITARHSLPSGRAVVGALLVTISALGLYAANRAAAAPPETTWLVARRDIPSGHRITAADLGRARMQLISETEAVSFSDPGDVIGHLSISPVAKDELLQRSDIATHRAATGSARRLTLDLTAAQALNGQIAPGDLVDIAATGADPGSTQLIVRSALVSAVDSGDGGGVGARGGVRVSLIVADADAAALVIDSAEHGKVTLIVATDLGGND